MELSRRLFILSLSFLISFQAQGQLVVEELKGKSPLDANKAAKKAAKPTSLALQKKAEIEYRWADCIAQAKINLKKYSSVKQWVMVSYLKCAKEQGVNAKNLAALQLVEKTFAADSDFQKEGPWQESLREEYVAVKMLLLEQLSKSNLKAAWSEAEYLLSHPDLLSKSDMAKVYMHAGEISQARAQLKAAQNFFEESLDRQESKMAREKLNSVLFAIGKEKIAPEVKETEEEPVSEEEKKFENRVRMATKEDDRLSLLEDSVQYLLNFPNGKRAKWAHDRISETYLSIADRGSEGNKEQALRSVLKSDASRLLEWARVFHRRGEFDASLALSEKALVSLGSSVHGAILLYIAGRSAQFTGAYSKAQKYFETYIHQHSAAEDIAEVYFRLALTYLRQSQASSAIATFEKLLLQKRIDRFELSAKYWMIRSLQATNNPRAVGIADEVIQKYPFSYYGLRLAMERSGGKISWPTALEQTQTLQSQYYLFSFEKKILARMTLLAENNWLKEAFSEAATLPMPKDAEGKVLLAQKLNHLQIYPGAIRLINEAGDISPELRSLDIINLSLPDSHRKVVETEAFKQKLSPILVKSLIRQESAFAPYAVSTSKAYGLMQLIGPTAQEVAGEIGLANLKVPEEVFQPDINVKMGTYYIAKMISQFGGNVPLGLAAYNAGPTRMRVFVRARTEVQAQTEKQSSDPWDEMWFDEIPWFETSFYVKAILRNSIMYRLSETARAPQPDQRLVTFGPVLWADLVLKQ